MLRVFVYNEFKQAQVRVRRRNVEQKLVVQIPSFFNFRPKKLGCYLLYRYDVCLFVQFICLTYIVVVNHSCKYNIVQCTTSRALQYCIIAARFETKTLFSLTRSHRRGRLQICIVVGETILSILVIKLNYSLTLLINTHEYLVIKYCKLNYSKYHFRKVGQVGLGAI